MGDTENKSWTSRELGIHIAKEQAKMGEMIAAKIVEALPVLIESDGRQLSIKEGIERLTGLPADFVPRLTAELAEKNGVGAELISKIAPFAFDLVMTAAAIGYAEGSKQASLSKGAAS